MRAVKPIYWIRFLAVIGVGLAPNAFAQSGATPSSGSWTTAVTDLINQWLTGYIQNVSASLSAMVGGLLLGIGTLMLIFHGYSMVMGSASPFMTFVYKYGKIFIWSMIGLGIGVTNATLTAVFTGLASALLSSFAQTTSSSGGGFSGAMATFWTNVENCISYTAFASSVAGSGTSGNWLVNLLTSGPGGAMEGLLVALQLMGAAFLMAVGAGLITLASLVTYLGAQICLAIVMASAPIFVTMGGFEKTERYFHSWLSTALSMVFLIGLCGALMGLAIAIDNGIMFGNTAGIATHAASVSAGGSSGTLNTTQGIYGLLSTMNTASQVAAMMGTLEMDMVIWLFANLLIVYLFFQLPALAHGLFGGASVQSAGVFAVETGVVGRMMNRVRGGRKKTDKPGGGKIQEG